MTTAEERQPVHGGQHRTVLDTAGHAPLAGLAWATMEPPPGESDEHLLQVIERHAHAEADDLASYRRLAETSRDPVIAAVLGLVMADEAGHHAQLERLAATLRNSLYWQHSSETRLGGGAAEAHEAARALGEVRALAQHERLGARRLRDLALEAKHLQQWLAAALLEAMALDSQKHEMLLGYVARRMEAGR